MITYVQNEFFTAPAQTLVNAVNTVGVMGRGVAAEFKSAFPEMFGSYKRRCQERDLVPGTLHLFRTPNKWILNFPTKRHWKPKSRLDFIESGMEAFLEAYAEHGISSVAFPQLGCGTGGLDWESQVRPLMESYLMNLPIPVSIHVYSPQSGTGSSLPTDTSALRSDPTLLTIEMLLADYSQIRDLLSIAGTPGTDHEDVQALHSALRTSGYASRYSIPMLHSVQPAKILDTARRLPYMRRATVYQDGIQANPASALFIAHDVRLEAWDDPHLQALGTEEMLWGRSTQTHLQFSWDQLSMHRGCLTIK